LKQLLGFNEKSKIYIYIYIYFILMFLFYFAYIWMDSHPFKPPINNVLTQKDVDLQLQKWHLKHVFELMFIFLFVLTMFISCYRRNIKIIIGFISVNIILFVGITLISYILFSIGLLNIFGNLVDKIPIGNVTDPMRIPVSLMVILLIYTVCLWLFKKSPTKQQ
jgi:hypothetical protein